MTKTIDGKALAAGGRIFGHTDVRARLRSMKARLPPSLLFAGPTGIGKKLVALEFARDLTGETRTLDLSQPLAQTEAIFFVAPDGASIKIEQIREAIHFLSLARDGRPLVLVFNDAHLIGPQAANALLKSVEEPPPGVHFIFVTPSPALMLQTLRSRSQVVRFAPLSNEHVRNVVQAVDETLRLEDWALEMSSGSPAAAIEMQRGGVDAGDLLPAVERLVESCGPASQDVERTEALMALRETLKDREQHVLALRFLVRTMNTAWRRHTIQGGAKISPQVGLRTDAQVSCAWLSDLPFVGLDEATDLSLTAEADLARNVDRQLLWESLASRLAGVAKAHRNDVAGGALR